MARVCSRSSGQGTYQPSPGVLAKLNHELEQAKTDGDVSADETERREREFEQEMFAKGYFSHIPPRKMTDAEFEDFEPLEIEGESLSEQIIRERR